jgi:hypothetical protein
MQARVIALFLRRLENLFGLCLQPARKIARYINPKQEYRSHE